MRRSSHDDTAYDDRRAMRISSDDLLLDCRDLRGRGTEMLCRLLQSQATWREFRRVCALASNEKANYPCRASSTSTCSFSRRKRRRQGGERETFARVHVVLTGDRIALRDLYLFPVARKVCQVSRRKSLQNTYLGLRSWVCRWCQLTLKAAKPLR